MRFLFLLLFVFFSCSNSVKKNDAVYARVGEKTLTKKDISMMKNGDLVETGSIKNIVDSWIEKTLLYNEAVKINLDKDHILLEQKRLFYKNLLINSLIDIKTKKEIKILKKEISNYYKNNKNSFIRNHDEILLKHFVLPTKKEARKLKNYLKSNKKGDILESYIMKYKPETKTIKDGSINENQLGFIFNSSVGDILGPKKIQSSYHVFEILRKYNKESIRGLEIVYDEIYQRLFKIKKMQFLNNFLDSLYTNADIYLSPEVGE
tara:strand:+ start:823 stop:1611 length:789 start_codon:yes stop_codon:yes gene_type:complete